jgi:UDPglucose--hexose-1-phosphate uridylyltransferase
VPQFRRDPFGLAWVIISPERGLEPSDFGSAGTPPERSPLSPGNETALGREVRALRPSGSPDWSVRVFEANTGLLEASKPFRVMGDPLFQHAASSGFQEIVVEHPDARMTLEAMPQAHLTEVLKVYRERLEALSQKPTIRHVQLTRNVGAVAGATWAHPHAQVLAVPVVSRWLEEEVEAAGRHYRESGGCLFCAVLDAELRARERVVSVNEHFVAFAPYASKTPFETWIVPRQHASSFAGLPGNVAPALADILRSVLKAMNGALADPPYNLLLHTLPREDDLGYHWHIELLPRLTRQSGFDWSSGFYVNPTPPEDAARFLREALALLEVEL